MQCSLSCNLTKQHFILFNAVKKELLILVSDIRGIKFHTGKDLLPSFRGINKLLLQQHPTLLFNIYPFKFVFLYSPNLILRHTRMLCHLSIVWQEETVNLSKKSHSSTPSFLNTTLQSIMNAKLSQHRFWHCHKNRLIKTIQTIPHNL